ncbi:hypothetical protein [Streptomyces niveus]|uniref:hypothetical protein n=1 Tax=Streptomyces niveus TaxID=193462 RepID=UPI0040646581
MAPGQAAPSEVDGKDVGIGGVALIGDEVRFDGGEFTRFEPSASVEEESLTVENDGLVKAVLPDVVGEGVEVVLVEYGEEGDGRVEFDGGAPGVRERGNGRRGCRGGGR